MTDPAPRRVLVLAGGPDPDAPEDIGIAAALEFARLGAHVQLALPDADLVRQARERLGATDPQARVHTLDPRDSPGLTRLVESVAEEWGGLDVLITSYAGGLRGTISSTSAAALIEAYEYNVVAPFSATMACADLLAAGHDPAVVHVSSIDGVLGNPNVAPYSISKGGTNVLIHLLAAELSARGIRVNGILRASSTAAELPEPMVAALSNATPLARAGHPAEYAQPIAFLASPAASYLTGVILAVDGGRTAVTPGATPGYQGYVAHVAAHPGRD